LFRIENDHIVRFIGASWFKPADIMLVTEYMSNGDLQNYLRKHNSNLFSWKQKMICALGISEGLVYLHSFNPKIIHRDLKSANILLNADLQAKITDFGVSRKLDIETMTADIGTFRWMAPEVLTSGHYSESADIFSFGVILSELDTHGIPYAGASSKGKAMMDAAILAKVIKGELRPLFTGKCPQVIRDIAAECLSFNPEQRPRATQVSYQLRMALKKM